MDNVGRRSFCTFQKQPADDTQTLTCGDCCHRVYCASSDIWFRSAFDRILVFCHRLFESTTMSSTDTSIHKRKALSPEASSSSNDHQSDQHESKKPRKDTTAHADDCEDPDCEGCAEGEIVLQFDTPPSAVELFQMAREEALKKPTSMDSGSGLSRMAKALFDKAIEEFEALDKANAHIEINDGTEVASKMVETKIHHAACVVAIGNFMPSSEMLQEGTRMFEDLVKRTAQKNGNALVGLGIAEISQARDVRRQAMKALDPEDEGEDEEPSEEQRDAATFVGKPEALLIYQVLEHFTKGLGLLKGEVGSAFTEECIRAAQELEEYGVSLDLTYNIDLATKVFDQAIQHLEDAQESKSELFNSSADVLSVYGSCLYSKARLVDNQSQGDENPAKDFVEKAIELLVKAEGMQDEEGDAKTLEALGQAYLMSTGLIEDEDMIMERFDAATEKLSRALELDPYNDALRAQVDALQGDGGGEEDYELENGDEDEGEDEDEDEDEEGNDA
ncbi:hypothetical protein BC939DRAFT_438046 [Gamsiella multidivaricata]|uniref:uncharacterized protein n=1 Tax=Gamsiella multidivaricata TaxID=101098 RepID=UPI00222128A1|nr:uncharacterized protein BC939DRAFT_438046 [Gamsiella multidivaricata]KAI7831262.1 hypothetical protein BC939DRAFT_438046 [Gamsiella multidivaricata]